MTLHRIVQSGLNAGRHLLEREGLRAMLPQEDVVNGDIAAEADATDGLDCVVLPGVIVLQ